MRSSAIIYKRAQSWDQKIQNEQKLTKNKCDFGGTVFSTILETQYVECALEKGLAQHVTKSPS